MRAKILIVDDDPDIVIMLEDSLQASGYETVVATEGQQALDQIVQESPQLVLLDLTLPKISGLDVLKRLAQMKLSESPPVIIITAHASIETAVEAMKVGACDFLTKPLGRDHLLIVIRKALEQEYLRRQIGYLRSEVDSQYATIVGNSESIKRLMESAQLAAKSDASVLLLGESGTGKELFARSIHRWSHRCAMPLIVINCVALTETLLENELFGHERGAFTGADRQQKGKLEMADGGTVFLDEIGDMSLPLQTKLLRVLQDREFHRVGGSKTVSVNIRIIAATNKDLRQAVRAGQFREELYFRLNVVTLTLPPLRERQGDVVALSQFFLERHARDAKRQNMTLSQAALDALSRYSWPGNIRELHDVICRAVVLSPSDVIAPEVLAVSSNERQAAETVQALLSLQESSSLPIYPYIMGGLLHNALNIMGGMLHNALKAIKMLDAITNDSFQLDKLARSRESAKMEGTLALKPTMEKIVPAAQHLSILLQTMLHITHSFYTQEEHKSVYAQVDKAISSFVEANSEVTYHCKIDNALDQISMPAGVSIFIAGELLKNATKACVNRSKAEIWLTIEVMGIRELSFECQDTGVGFSEEMLGRIHAHDLLPTKGNQIGHGLYLIEVLAHRLGGSLLVSNRESGGARIQVLLPLTVKKG